MTKRLKLDKSLKDVLGSLNVYYQPPENQKITKPCFIYKLSNIKPTYADNKQYLRRECYEVTYLTKTVDDDIFKSIIQNGLSATMYVKFERMFISNNLYHYVFTVYI